MKTKTKSGERGIALFFSIFALLLLTAIGAALIFMATTETSVNSNYRQEQIAFFAAKAGIEEARARMMPSDPNTINLNGTGLPTAAPTNDTISQIIYIVNPGTGAAVQPWTATNKYADNELCHDYIGDLALGLTVVAPDVPCAKASLAANGYLSYNSQLPFSTTAPVPYKWVRIAPKVNDSMLGPGTTVTNTYSVNSTLGTTATPVCWDGANEWVLTKPVCNQMSSSKSTYMNNVYVVTALGVSSDAPNAARRVLQAEVALTPTPPFPYGLYATSTACPAISFTGQNPSTDSYTTAGGQTYASSNTNTGGDIGANGGVSVQNGNIGGIVGVLQPPPAGNGTCATPLTINNPGGTMGGTVTCPTGDNSNPPTSCYLPQPYVFPTPPLPNPLPPITNYTPPACGGKKKGSGQCMVPGSYGNITVNGTLYLAPGTYNVNELSMQGNGQIIVSPPGAVTLNVAGCANTTCSSTLGNPLSIAGNGITDDTNPNDFIINYAGSGTVSIAGNGNVTSILNAPNAAITQQGNGNWYGSIIGSTVTIGGNAFFHFDRASALAPVNNGYYTLVSFREVPY